MKNTKTLLFILIGLTLTFVIGIAMYSTVAEIKIMDYVIYTAVGLIVVFTIITYFKRYLDEQKGLTTEDELSQRIKERAAAHSFGASFYLWTLILLSTLDSNLDKEIILGIGIIGMGLLFAGFWIYQNNKGIDSGNSN